MNVTVDRALGYLWAKTSQTGSNWHPLILHVLDVAAAADAILAREPESTRNRMAAILGMGWEAVVCCWSDALRTRFDLHCCGSIITLLQPCRESLMNWRERIVTDAGTCGGRPRIKGTRITVEFLLGLKAVGWTEEQILESYPHLTREDLQAVFAYAQTILEDESFVPVARVG